jgi:autotransporter translocation and assembly factor TamB
LLLLILIIRIPSVQQRITQKAVSFLQTKLGTVVTLKKIYISFPKNVILEELYVEDQTKDTLLFAGELSINTDLLALVNSRIQLNDVNLANCKATIQRSQTDSAFNFDFISAAFSSPAVSTDTTPSDWEFSVGNVNLSTVSVVYNDAYTGTDLDVKLGELAIDVDKFDLNGYEFLLESLSLENSRINISLIPKDSTEITTRKDDAPFPFSIDFDNLNLENVDLHYEQLVAGQTLNLKIGELAVEANEIDLNRYLIDLDEIDLRRTFISFSQNLVEEKEPVLKNDSAIQRIEFNLPWHIKLSALTLTDNNLQYYNFNEPVLSGTLDFNHLWMWGLQTSANDIELKGSTIRAELDNFAVEEKSGFSIQSLSAEILLTHTELALKKFILDSGLSHISLDGEASFTSFEELPTQYAKAKVKLNVKKSVVCLQDILFFSPTLLDSLPLHVPVTTTLSMDAVVQGTVNDLNIGRLNLAALDSTSVRLYGTVKGLPNVNQCAMTIHLEKFYSTNADIRTVVTDTLLPETVQLPRWIDITGETSGLLLAPKFEMRLMSSSGAIEAKGEIDTRSKTSYAIALRSREFHLGELLKQKETMGTLDMEASLKGSGLSMEELDALIDVTILNFKYYEYEYRDFKLNGSLKKYLFSGDASLHDENLDFTLKGDMDYANEAPLYKFKFDLKNADFKQLHLSARPLRARGIVDVNLATRDFKVINGNLDVRQVAIYNGEALYMVDSLLFASIDQQGESNISIRSDILTGDFKGTFNIFSLPGVLKQHINRYFSLQEVDTVKSLTPQNFSFDLTIKNTDLITEIIFPELEPFVPGTIKGSFDSENSRLNIAVNLSKLTYSRVGADSFLIKISSDPTTLNYNIALKRIVVDTLRIDAFQLTGEIRNDSIRTRLLILDSLEQRKYVLGGVIRSQENKFRFNFLPDQVVLNYEKWTVPNDNFMQFGMAGIHANNFSIANGEQRIALVTESKDSTVSFVFHELQLANLTQVVAGNVPASGRLNGDFKFTTAHQGRFSSKLLIDDLSIVQKPWGDVSFSLTHANAKYTIDLQVKDQKSNLHATGFYLATEASPTFDFTVDLSPLNLQLIEPLSYGQLKNVKGLASGTLKISGSMNKPSILGKINFKEASFLATYLNNSFSLKNETIEFTQSGISFTNFTIRDDKNNEASVKGKILTTAYKEFEFDMYLLTKNFRVLNTTKEDNSLYFGNVSVNARANITGDSRLPKVGIAVRLTKGSELTYIVPQAQRMVVEQEGIVKFIDRDAIKDPFLSGISIKDTVNSEVRGIELSANLELTGDEILNIIIDPVTGDKLSVQGTSTLTLDIDPTGNIDLAGRYEITKGSYNLSFYKLVKRNFAIVKGSTITWTGNPLNASLDIKASHTVDASPLELVSNQINTDEPEKVNRFKQRLPFLVYLIIKGQLLTPDIRFQLDMPMDKRNAEGGAIYAKIQDINTRESDLNKQVFALLILKRFIADNSLESQAGSDLNNTARISVSRLLSEQLNRLSENVKGIQLSVDVRSYEDYSTGGGQTQVQLGVSKNLFNDRLVVKLSGNVDIEGETTTREEATDYIGDLALEYKLTSDGRFRVTGFRNSNYDMIDGDLTETGAGLIYIKDYNTLRELFKSNATEK